MAIQAVTPFIFKNIIVSFGANDYAKAVNSAQLIPSGGMVTYKGGKPDAVFTFPEAVSWEFQIVWAQDWGTAASLSRYLFDNIGTNVACVFNADDKATKTTSWAFTVALTAGAVGAAIDAVATAQATLGVVGAPVPTLVP